MHTPAWSRDGSKVAFSYSLVREEYDDALDLNRAIWIANADGTDRRQVTSLTPNSFWDDEPQWSPDGTKLVFTRVDLRRKRDAVFTVDVESGDVFQLTPWALNAAGDPEWSPDGRWIVFIAHPSDGSENVNKVRPDGTGRTNLTKQKAGGLPLPVVELLPGRKVHRVGPHARDGSERPRRPRCHEVGRLEDPPDHEDAALGELGRLGPARLGRRSVEGARP